jgi:hypothetical protein
MFSVLNRHLVLNPAMTSVGIGAAMHAPRGWIWVVAFNPAGDPRDGPVPVIYPHADQKDVPLFFGRGIAQVAPEQPKNTPAGFSITANFFTGQRLTNVTASLVDSRGQDVPCWLSTPQKPLRNVGGYQQILLIPKKPLAAATTYTVTMRANVERNAWTKTWSFTTTDPQRDQAAMGRLLLDQVNRARRAAGLAKVTLDADLSRGCAAHAEYAVRNIDHPKLAGLGIHEEDATLPGATPKGAKAGKAAIIAVLSDPVDSVAGWEATLYHRIPLFDRQLKRLGYGQALHPSRGWVTVLDTGNGK